MKRTGEPPPAEVGMSKHRGQCVMGERLVWIKCQLSQHGTEVTQLAIDSESTPTVIAKAYSSFLEVLQRQAITCSKDLR